MEQREPVVRVEIIRGLVVIALVVATATVSTVSQAFAQNQAGLIFSAAIAGYYGAADHRKP